MVRVTTATHGALELERRPAQQQAAARMARRLHRPARHDHVVRAVSHRIVGVHGHAAPAEQPGPKALTGAKLDDAAGRPARHGGQGGLARQRKCEYCRDRPDDSLVELQEPAHSVLRCVAGENLRLGPHDGRWHERVQERGESGFVSRARHCTLRREGAVLASVSGGEVLE
jgi:hypothetical protein